MKKLLHLGGAPAQVPAIRYAVEAGYHVITVDYLPGNPGHKLSHEYYDMSTTDIAGVYELARSLDIDGIASYASDPAARTVGYVAERLGLIGPGEEAAKTLTHKGLFRKLMKDCGLKTPEYQLFDKSEEAIDYLHRHKSNRMIKPVDSSGSKGVYRYTGREDGPTMIHDAFRLSQKKEIIIEEYIPSSTPQIQGEGFVVEGKVRFLLFGDQKMSAYNPAVPASTSFPTSRSRQEIELCEGMVTQIIDVSGFRNGGINIEIIQDTDGQYHLLEVGPRNGGNFMPQLVRRSTGVDLVRMGIDRAMGKKVKEIKVSEINPHSQLIIHSPHSGTFRSLDYKDGIEEYVVEEHLYKNSGDPVRAYQGSNDVIGVSLLALPQIGEVNDRHSRIQNYIDLQTDE